MGEDAFLQLCHHYIDSYPSHFKSIRWVGKYLPAFISTIPSLDSSFFKELAEFEWLLTEVFDEADSGTITQNDMISIPLDQWPYLHFKLHPSMRRVNLNWDICHSWIMLKENNQHDVPNKISLTTCLLWRKQLDVQFRYLTPNESILIEAIHINKNFSDICVELCQQNDEQQVAMIAATILKQLILDEMITEIQK
jgi:hypothetical protein